MDQKEQLYAGSVGRGLIVVILGVLGFLSEWGHRAFAEGALGTLGALTDWAWRAGVLLLLWEISAHLRSRK